MPGARRPGSHSFRSVAELWHHRIASTPDGDALYYRAGEGFVVMTWREAGLRVRAIANGLLAFGLAPEDRGGILSETRVEWILADMGLLCAGGATTTLFPTSPDSDVEAILRHSDAVVVFCDTAAQAARLRTLRERLPKLRRVVVFDDPTDDDGWVCGLDTLEARGKAHAEQHPDAYQRAVDAIGPERLATLLYTSGTTGEPKGVMLTHDAWVYESEAIDRLGLISPADKQFLFLPLAHVFAKVLEIVFVRLGVPTVVDGDTDALLANLVQTRPTWLAGVPRVFERVHDAILREAQEAGPVQKRLFHWAVGVGRDVSQLRQQRREPTGLLRAQWLLANRLVYQRIKDRFGGRLRFAISGGAPLSREIAEFFHAVDLLVLEGYGLTESSAASTVNTPDDYVFGTVGRPLPGCEVRIAEDGEILLRSRGLMKGYLRDAEGTAQVIDGEGFLHTGDIGILLDSGHLRITDRKKDILVTAGGKNIAPAQFQDRFTARCPYATHVLVHGDTRPYCVALVAPDVDALSRWARSKNLSFADLGDLVRRSEVSALLQGYVDEVNRTLAPWETVRKFAVLPEPFTVENGFLTPSLKIKRRVVEDRYQSVLDGLYDGPRSRW